METIIIENINKKQALLLKELANQLGLKALLKSNGKKSTANEITNPEILKRIEKYESGKSKLIEFKNINEFNKYLKKSQTKYA